MQECLCVRENRVECVVMVDNDDVDEIMSALDESQDGGDAVSRWGL